MTYDNLYRLSTIKTTYSNGNGNYGPPMNKTISYDVLGNITYRSEIGTYNYGGAGPHQVQSITGGSNTGFTSTNYSYDANGNATSGDGYTTQWNSFNMASSVQQGTVTDAFTYDADHNRASQTETNNGSPVDIIYYFFDPITGLEADYTTAPNGSTINWKDYVKIAGQLIMVHTMTPSNTAGVNNYFVQDHLGSVAVVVQDTPSGCSGAKLGATNSCVLERDSYDAWGLRRNSNGTDLPIGQSSYNSSVEKKGYTGQEQLQGVGLLNYNARMYDPLVGKFLSPDPDVQVENLQAMNPYSYVLNNPLSNTDPTGMKCHGGFFAGCISFNDVLRIVSIAVAVVAPYALAYELGEVASFGTLATGLEGAENFAIAGAASAAISSKGNINAVLIGAASAVAFDGVGSLTDGGSGGYAAGIVGKAAGGGEVGAAADYAAQVAGDGLVGGLASIASGGSFQSGFLASGFASAASPYEGDGVGGVIEHSLVGGVGSVIGGGSFANGAETGAFEDLFNKTISIAGSINLGSIQKWIFGSSATYDVGVAVSFPSMWDSTPTSWDVGVTNGETVNVGATMSWAKAWSPLDILKNLFSVNILSTQNGFGDLSGKSGLVTINGGEYSMTYIYHPNGQQYGGALGMGAPAIGISGGVSDTCVHSLRGSYGC